jgi:hypothetical protein
MGSFAHRRRLRAALSFILRPLLLALGLTFVVRFLFSSPKAPRHTKALVVASTQKTAGEASDWLAKVPKDWAIHKSVVDAEIPPKSTKREKVFAVPVNKGNEAMVYLTYIIENYHNLPEVVFFHHDHSKAWHQELTSDQEVAKLRTSYVLEKGFVSARCLPGCENVIQLVDYTIDMKVFSYHGREAHLSTLLRTFLEPGEKIPMKLAAPCCAQFAASREAILRRRQEWWKGLRDWLTDTPLDNKSSGRLLEHTWHVWLGEEAE